MAVGSEVIKWHALSKNAILPLAEAIGKFYLHRTVYVSLLKQVHLSVYFPPADFKNQRNFVERKYK